MRSNWRLQKLGAMLEQNTTSERLELHKSYKLLGVRLEGKGAFIREEKPGSQIRAGRLRKVSSGEFIYSRLFAWRGAFAVIPPDMDGAYVSNEFPTFEADRRWVFPRFLELYFKQRWVWDDVERYCTGTTKASRNRFKEKFFLNLEVPLPSADEQKRIVAKIERLMAKIEEARRLRAQAVEDLKELLLTQLRKTFSDKSIMRVQKSVEEICSKPQYGYTDSAKDEPVGPKFLRITDIQNGKVDWEHVPYSTCPEKHKYLLSPGDILFARSGATTGKSFLVKLPPESVFASYLIRIRPKEVVLPEYLYWYFQSPLYWSQVMEERKGSAQPNMNGQKLSNVLVPIPDSKGIQCQIVDYFDSLQASIDKLKSLQAKTAQEIEELIPSILDKAFKGEL